MKSRTAREKEAARMREKRRALRQTNPPKTNPWRLGPCLNTKRAKETFTTNRNHSEFGHD